jgi:hypothetical protein
MGTGMRNILRRWRWFLVLLVVVIIGTAGIVWTSPGVNWINYCKIRHGMTEHDISRLLGTPPRVGDPVFPSTSWADDTDSQWISVDWDPNHRVKNKSYRSSGIIGRLQKWLSEYGI